MNGPTEKSLFLYRFDPLSGKSYGPKPLEWIAGAYGDRPELECAPMDQLTGPNDWRSFQSWAGSVTPAPASAMQIARVRRLYPQAPPAMLTYQEARDLIRDAEAKLPPTSMLAKRAADAGLDLRPGETRASLKDRIEAKKLEELAESLRAGGAVLPLASDEDAIYDAADAGDAMDRGIELAKERGFDVPRLARWTAEEATALGSACEKFWSAAGDLGWRYEGLRDDGVIPRIPPKTVLRQLLPELMSRIRAGRWTESDDDYLSLLKYSEADSNAR